MFHEGSKKEEGARDVAWSGCRRSVIAHRNTQPVFRRGAPPPTLNEERKRANARGVNFKVDPNTRTTSFAGELSSGFTFASTWTRSTGREKEGKEEEEEEGSSFEVEKELTARWPGTL